MFSEGYSHVFVIDGNIALETLWKHVPKYFAQEVTKVLGRRAAPEMRPYA